MSVSPAHRARNQVTCGELTRGELKELLLPTAGRPKTTSNSATTHAAYRTARPRTHGTHKRRGHKSRSAKRRPRTSAPPHAAAAAAASSSLSSSLHSCPETPEGHICPGLDFGQRQWTSPQELLHVKDNVMSLEIALIEKEKIISEQSSQLKRLNQERTSAVIEQSKLMGEVKAMQVRPWTASLPAAANGPNCQEHIGDVGRESENVTDGRGNNNSSNQSAQDEEVLVQQVESLEATVVRMADAELDTKRHVERLEKDNRDIAQALLKERTQARQLAASLHSNVHTRLTVPSFPCLGETLEAKELAMERQWRAQLALQSITAGVTSAKTLEAMLKSERGQLRTAVKERGKLQTERTRQDRTLALTKEQVTMLKDEVGQLRETISTKDRELMRQQGSLQRFASRQEKFSRAVEALEKLEVVAREKEKRELGMQEHYRMLDAPAPHSRNSRRHTRQLKILTKMPDLNKKEDSAISTSAESKAVPLPAVAAEVSTSQHSALKSAIATLVKENKTSIRESKGLKARLLKAEAGLADARQTQLDLTTELNATKDLLNARKTNSNARSRLMSRARSSTLVGGIVVNVLHSQSTFSHVAHDAPHTSRSHLDDASTAHDNQLHSPRNRERSSLLHEDSVTDAVERPSTVGICETTSSESKRTRGGGRDEHEFDDSQESPEGSRHSATRERQPSQAAIALRELAALGGGSVLLGPPSARGQSDTTKRTCNVNMDRTAESMQTLVNEDMHGSYEMTSKLALQLMDVIQWAHNTGSTCSLPDFSVQVERKAKQLCPTEHVTLYLVNGSRTKLQTRLQATGSYVEIPINHGVPGFVAMRGEALHIPNMMREDRFDDDILQGHTGSEPFNLLALPLWSPADEQVMGVLLMTNRVVEGDRALERLARRRGLGELKTVHAGKTRKSLSHIQKLSLSFSIVDEELLRTFLAQVAMLLTNKRKEYVEDQKLKQLAHLQSQLPQLSCHFVKCAPMISHAFVHQIERMCANICGVRHAVVYLVIPRSSEDDDDVGMMWASQRSWSKHRQLEGEVGEDGNSSVAMVGNVDNGAGAECVSGPGDNSESLELGSKYIPMVSAAASIASRVMLTGVAETSGQPRKHPAHNPNVDMCTPAAGSPEVFISVPILTPESGYTSSDMFADDKVGPALGCVQLQMPSHLDKVELREKISRCASVVAPFLNVVALSVDAMWQVIDLAEMAGDAGDDDDDASTVTGESDAGYYLRRENSSFFKSTDDFARRARRNTQLRVRASIKSGDATRPRVPSRESRPRSHESQRATVVGRMIDEKEEECDEEEGREYHQNGGLF